MYCKQAFAIGGRNVVCAENPAALVWYKLDIQGKKGERRKKRRKKKRKKLARE